MSGEQAEKSEQPATPIVVEMHKPPSMLWFVIPLGLLFAYALLTK